METITDANALYAAFRRSQQNSAWKPQVQRFEMNYLTELSKLQHELMDRTYKTSPATEFIISERGKTRPITGQHIRDRVVRHVLTDNVLEPATRPYLIYDNGSSLKDRGVSFTRKRIVTHLRKYYARHGSNDGYILLIDFSKYYDNIWHSVYFEQIAEHTDDEAALWLLGRILADAEVDVSYMTDEEYERCMDTPFNSLEHRKIPPEKLTGEKFMAKSMDIGDQVSQNAGIYYPHRIDNYVKIVRGCKYYARYMDDSYIIHEDKEFLKALLRDITEQAAAIGITVNQRKTRICKLSTMFRFLQIGYALTDTGRVIQKIHPKRITAMRRKLKKLAVKYEAGQIPLQDIELMYQSWMGGHYKIMSRAQRQGMNDLYKQLFNKEDNDGKELHGNTGRRDAAHRARPEWEQFHLVEKGRSIDF